MVEKNTIVEDDENEDLKEGGEVVAVEHHEEEHHDEDEGDERLSHEQRDDDEDDDRSSKRDHRRKQKDKRKAAMERDKALIDALKRQNEEFAARLAAIEGRAQQQDLSMLDQRLNESVSHVQRAEQILAEAVKRGDGGKVAEALRYRDEAIQKARELNTVKTQATQQRQQQPGVDPIVKRLANEWMEQNSWYDPKGGDDDSAIVLTIDNRLAAEGYKPDSREYWEELQNRVERILPHRYGSQERRPAQRKGPPIGGGREHAPASTRNEVYVSPERKQALIEAGYWDDPKKRARALKQMQSWDREHLAKK